MEVEQISVHELDRLMVLNKPFVLLDVREPEELEIARIDPCLHVPMDDIPNRLSDIPKDVDVLVLCSAGNRSNQVARYLLEQGYSNVKNVAGGIIQYAQEVDDSVLK